MKQQVIGQPQKAPIFSAFHWSPHGSLVSIGQHFVTKTETSLITKADLITVSDPAVRAVHSCNSWLSLYILVTILPVTRISET